MTNEENIKRFEEAIERLKIKAEERCYEICWNKRGERYICTHCKVGECFDIAIESIEKQIPKKPISTENFGGGCCPYCETYLHIDYEEPKCCWNCGQAIDWN